MQVYVEYALAENFSMDFALLFVAKAASKNPAKYWRIVLSSALGACFAIVFPLFKVGGVVALLIKIAAGAAMCALAGKYSSFKGYLKFTAIFTAATFLVGGALIALFSLSGIAYSGGGGYILSSVPVGIPLAFVCVLAIVVKTIRRKVVASKNIQAECRICVGVNTACCKAFYDSGNKVFFNGAPVSIVPAHIAKKLTEGVSIKNFTNIHTVTGKSKIALFTADKLEIDDGKNKITRQNVTLGISPRFIHKIVLNPDLAEVN